jgi:hypothetical protein
MERLSLQIVAVQQFRRHMDLHWMVWFLQGWPNVQQKWSSSEGEAYCLWGIHTRLFSHTETFYMEVTLGLLPTVDSKGQVTLTHTMPHVICLFQFDTILKLFIVPGVFLYKTSLRNSPSPFCVIVLKCTSWNILTDTDLLVCVCVCARALALWDKLLTSMLKISVSITNYSRCRFLYFPSLTFTSDKDNILWMQEIRGSKNGLEPWCSVGWYSLPTILCIYHLIIIIITVIISKKWILSVEWSCLLAVWDAWMEFPALEMKSRKYIMYSWCRIFTWLGTISKFFKLGILPHHYTIQGYIQKFLDWINN